jgi:branched-chain amino acid transport system substrate-binding protein
MKNRSWLLITVLLAIVMATGSFIGCSSSPNVTPTTTAPSVTTAPPVKVAVIGEFTGAGYEPEGKNYQGGARLAVKEINDAGGILNGRQVQLIEIPEGYTGDEVISAFKQAISDGVKAIVGGTEAEQDDAALPLALDAKIPTVITIGSIIQGLDPTWNQGLVFHISAYPPQRSVGFKDLVEQRGYKTISVLNLDASYGYQVTDLVKSWWGGPNSPVKILNFVYYPYGSTDPTAQLTKLVQGNPDVVWVGAWGSALVGKCLKTLEQLNYQGDVIFDVLCMNQATADDLGSLVEGKEGVYEWIPDPNNKANWDFVQAFQSLNGFVPDGSGTATYVGMKSILLAMDKAGTADDANKISKAMFDLDWSTPYGGKKCMFFPGGQFYLPEVGIGIVKDGQWVPETSVSVPLEAYNSPVNWYQLYQEQQGGNSTSGS